MYSKVSYLVGIGLALLCLAFELMSSGCDFSTDAIMGRQVKSADGGSGCSTAPTAPPASFDVSYPQDCSFSYIPSFLGVTASDNGAVVVEIAFAEGIGFSTELKTIEYGYSSSFLQAGSAWPLLELTCKQTATFTSETYTCTPPPGIQIKPSMTSYTDRLYSLQSAEGDIKLCGGQGNFSIVRGWSSLGCAEQWMGSLSPNNANSDWPAVTLVNGDGSTQTFPYLWVAEPPNGWPDGPSWPVTIPSPAPSNPSASPSPVPSPF